MEYGPRALGGRSILANPADPQITEKLNHRLKRSEFMPFAPVVNEQDAAEVFDLGNVNRYAARFMTISCGVRPPVARPYPRGRACRRERPAADHRAARRTLCYFDILAGFKARTGLPALVNTSLNVHEEPIVNRPEECLKTLAEGRVDFVVTPGNLARFRLSSGSQQRQEPRRRLDVGGQSAAALGLFGILAPRLRSESSRRAARRRRPPAASSRPSISAKPMTSEPQAAVAT